MNNFLLVFSEKLDFLGNFANFPDVAPLILGQRLTRHNTDTGLGHAKKRLDLHAEYNRRDKRYRHNNHKNNFLSPKKNWHMIKRCDFDIYTMIRRQIQLYTILADPGLVKSLILI